MNHDSDLQIRPGRIRDSRSSRVRPFIAQVLAATRKAGGHVSRHGAITKAPASRFGRGKVASVIAARGLAPRSRAVIVKARIVRHGRGGGNLANHLKYLERDGVTRDGEKGILFGAEGREIGRDSFATQAQDDRHHFRFIVSPEDALDMADLEGFSRDLMHQMQADLGTELDWVAVEHWNTAQPHVHIIVRGVASDGHDLVIARDYISEGLRAQARNLVTQELGLQTDLDIARGLERQIGAQRWTDIDRRLAHDQAREGLIDMAPRAGIRPDAIEFHKLGRLRTLETLGVACEIGRGQWMISDDAETQLREMGLRGDIIKRMNHALVGRGTQRAASSYVLDPPDVEQKIIGRLIDRGLHGELEGSAYVIIDGIDGRTHHIVLPDLEASGDGRLGAIVELRHFQDRKGRDRTALAVRSDMDIGAQVKAPGATWLDRRNVMQGGRDLGAGFGREVEAAMDARADHLVSQGLAHKQGQRTVFARNLINTLEANDLDAAAQRLSRAAGLPRHMPATGDYVAGTLQQRVTLASGRFAVIDNGLGFALVPWTPSLDTRLGKHISGVMREGGSVEWSFGRARGLGR